MGATSSTDIQRYQDQDMIIIGTPEMCLEKILRYEEAGVDQLLCYMQFGMLSHEKVMRSVELLGTQVLPELERRGHRGQRIRYGARHLGNDTRRTLSDWEGEQHDLIWASRTDAPSFRAPAISPSGLVTAGMSRFS